VVIFGNTVAWLLWLYILHVLRAGTAGLGTLLTPVIGISAAWIQLGERPSVSEGLGMIAIVSALLITVLWEIARERRRGAATYRGLERRDLADSGAEEGRP
jgi:drug/metabolite transporter (DMT)-like permease